MSLPIPRAVKQHRHKLASLHQAKAQGLPWHSCDDPAHLGFVRGRMLDLLHDKARFYQSVSCSTPPAAFRVVESAQQFDAAWLELKKDHPQLCIKPSVSVYGLGFAVIDEARSSAQLLVQGVQYHIGLEDLRRGFEAMGTFRPMLLMEYLDGHEFSVDCLGDNGRLDKSYGGDGRQNGTPDGIVQVPLGQGDGIAIALALQRQVTVILVGDLVPAE